MSWPLFGMLLALQATLIGIVLLIHALIGEVRRARAVIEQDFWNRNRDRAVDGWEAKK